jgi:DNA-binding NarL/FixJ family response regulator
VKWEKARPFFETANQGEAVATVTKRILFVDDEPMVLSGIERSLRTMRKEWKMEFVAGGSEALETMSQRPFDVVITDMRMPGMDGAQLLEHVKNRFPQTVRMALSGQSDRDTIFRCIGPTHQYLSKPCDIDEMKQKLTHAFALRDVLHDEQLKQLVSKMEAVPSMPALFGSLKVLLYSPYPPVLKVSEIIAKDMGMTAKVLQLVNCAFLGVPTRIASSTKAVSVVGVENIKTLVQNFNLFSEFKCPLPEELTNLWGHSFATAHFAKTIAQVEKTDEHTIECAFTAGFLHDIGTVILACSCEERAIMASETTLAVPADTFETHDNFHPQVGAYLLGLWGLQTKSLKPWHGITIPHTRNRPGSLL